VEHRERIRSEFARQAESLAASPALAAEEVTRKLAAALPPGAGRVLDLACGPAVLAPALAERARLVLGLDLVPEGLALASQRTAHLPSVGFVRGLAEATPLTDGSFDAVVLRLALHHVERPERVLAEARRVLQPAGHLLVLDLTSHADPEIAALHNALERLRDPSHTLCGTPAQLVAAVERTGFQVIRDERWTAPRRFDEWARIIADPIRRDALETVLRSLARAGVDAGLELREESDGALWFSYAWQLLVARAPA
jgi:ubiquinone/menaquinone biosynthesis C-methylase UbiE